MAGSNINNAQSRDIHIKSPRNNYRDGPGHLGLAGLKTRLTENQYSRRGLQRYVGAQIDEI